jgi:glutamyl-tRNA reductase
MNATGARLGMVGVSHRSAPSAVLETVSVPRADQPALLAALHEAGYREVVVLSTCSRTEVYAAWRATPSVGLLDLLARHAATPVHQLREHAEVRTDQAVVAHLLRVTAGLESRVIGEVEIQGQVRSAYRMAAAAGLIGPTLGPLFSAALRCGQRVRAQTTLGAQGRSLARRAVDIGLGTLVPADKTSPVVMVVGSGRMATTAVEHLRSMGLQPRVAARDEARAAQLAGPGGVCPLPALARGIAHADVLICATSAVHHVVTVEEVRAAMATRSRPLTVVDLSVPRNVDLAVASLPGVRLVDLDGLGDDPTADAELAAALHAGSRLVADAARLHREQSAARDAAPAIAALRQQVRQTCLDELRRIAPADVDPERVARAAHAVAGKLLHAPTMALRAAAAAGDDHTVRVLCAGLGVELPEVAVPAQVTVLRTA